MGHWNMPLDPNCPVAEEYQNNFFADPMTDSVPGDVIDDIMEDFQKRHRGSCRRCQEYGLDNVEAVYS